MKINPQQGGIMLYYPKIDYFIIILHPEGFY